MAKRAGPPAATRLRALHRALLQVGVAPGTELPRDCWDDLVIVTMEVGPASIRDYTKIGEAHGLWRTTQRHGQAGRGFVTILAGDEPAAAEA